MICRAALSAATLGEHKEPILRLRFETDHADPKAVTDRMRLFSSKGSALRLGQLMESLKMPPEQRLTRLDRDAVLGFVKTLESYKGAIVDMSVVKGYVTAYYPVARKPYGQDHTVPCETCGKPTTFKGTKRCNNCWEVEGRLDEYLKSWKGREHVMKLIGGE